MKRLALPHAHRLSILTACLLASSSVLAQTPAAVEPETAAKKDGGHEIRGLVVLRISGELLDRMMASDISKQEQIEMSVVGVRAKGPSQTVGTAEVLPKPDQDDAAFRVVVAGESRSQTSGRSGPAIVHSRSQTSWKVNKVVRFEEGMFVTRPGTIESHTDLWSAGIGSTLPGLRGRVVKRIGERRELELRAAATRSVDRQTSEKVLAEVDKSVDEKIAKLNERVQSRVVLSKLLPLLDSSAVHMSTNDTCIHLAFFGMESATGMVCPLDRLEPAETELWVNTSLLPTAMPAPPALPEAMQGWINQNLLGLALTELPIPVDEAIAEDSLPPMTVQLVDDWIVLRTEAPKEPTVAKASVARIEK